jgi:hypothetical protein
VSLSETPADGEQQPTASSDAGAGAGIIAASHESNPAPAAAEPRWGFWATIGFSLLVLAVFVVLQTVVAIGFVAVQMLAGDRIPSPADAAALGSNGLLLSLTTWVSMPACLALVCLFAKLKRGATIRGYLGLRGVPVGAGLIWIGIFLVYAVGVDGLTYALGRPIVPEFMVDAYKSAGFVPLLWLSLIVAAPIFEEAFFRGFMLEGIRRTRLGPIGAVLLTSLVWAGIHLQYDAYQVAVIFVGGLLFGTARIRSGSVLLTMAMHCLQNVLATLETVVYLHLNDGG